MTSAKSPDIRFPFLVLAVFAGAIALKLVAAPVESAHRASGDWPQSRAGQLIFFAVLEGLYHDGVDNSSVDLIIPHDKDGNPTFDREHFVYACPLCHPAFEAFGLYRKHARFYGLKANIDTFGRGIDPAIKVQLNSRDAAERREAIQRLINRWVAERLDMMRLSDSERTDITREVEQGRKRGMNGLKSSPNATQSRTNCPSCDGSFGACQLQAH